jgi:LysR family transcriptional regulator, glycine cleavage system transcriptional activator
MSFKRAAAELNVTPTAISHQILQLERYCGISLFRRQPRPLSLTDAGARLFPVIRDGLDGFEGAIAAVKRDGDKQPVRVTTTNACASHWLVPHVSRWRKRRPDVPLEIIGTDAVLSLEAREADVAIRIADRLPTDGLATELFRDRFVPVCSPRLISPKKSLRRPADLRGHVLIHWYWPRFVPNPPTWERWLGAARKRWRDVPEASELDHLNFREELHAIDAVVAGQGIGICSDVLTARQLASGTLVRALDLELPGYGFYLVRPHNHPRRSVVDDFARWLQSLGS